MVFKSGFFKTVAICSFAAALTIVLQPFIELFVDGDIPGYRDGYAMLIEWLRLASVLLGFMALWGIVAAKLDTHTGYAATALIFFVVWMVLELIFRSIRIFAKLGRWDPALAGNPEGSMSTVLQANINFLGGMTVAFMMVIIACAIIGGSLLGIATWRGDFLDKAVSIFLFLYAALGVVYIVGILGNQFAISVVQTTYHFLRSLDRIVWGVWLWRWSTRETEN